MPHLSYTSPTSRARSSERRDDGGSGSIHRHLPHFHYTSPTTLTIHKESSPGATQSFFSAASPSSGAAAAGPHALLQADNNYSLRPQNNREGSLSPSRGGAARDRMLSPQPRQASPPTRVLSPMAKAAAAAQKAAEDGETSVGPETIGFGRGTALSSSSPAGASPKLNQGSLAGNKSTMIVDEDGTGVRRKKGKHVKTPSESSSGSSKSSGSTKAPASGAKPTSGQQQQSRKRVNFKGPGSGDSAALNGTSAGASDNGKAATAKGPVKKRVVPAQTKNVQHELPEILVYPTDSPTRVDNKLQALAIALAQIDDDADDEGASEGVSSVQDPTSRRGSLAQHLGIHIPSNKDTARTAATKRPSAVGPRDINQNDATALAARHRAEAYRKLKEHYLATRGPEAREAYAAWKARGEIAGEPGVEVLEQELLVVENKSTAAEGVGKSGAAGYADGGADSGGPSGLSVLVAAAGVSLALDEGDEFEEGAEKVLAAEKTRVHRSTAADQSTGLPVSSRDAATAARRAESIASLGTMVVHLSHVRTGMGLPPDYDSDGDADPRELVEVESGDEAWGVAAADLRARAEDCACLVIGQALGDQAAVEAGARGEARKGAGQAGEAAGAGAIDGPEERRAAIRALLANRRANMRARYGPRAAAQLLAADEARAQARARARGEEEEDGEFSEGERGKSRGRRGVGRKGAGGSVLGSFGSVLGRLVVGGAVVLLAWLFVVLPERWPYYVGAVLILGMVSY